MVGMKRTRATWPGRPGRTMGRARVWALLAIVVLAVSACTGEPSEYGITGPFPEGVAPVTLTRPVPRMETSDDTPGVNTDAINRYAPTNKLRASNTPTRRYYGYDH